MHMYKPFSLISYNIGARNLVLENQECYQILSAS